MKRLIQITTVALALTALATYVIYSQRRHSPRIAPSSKASIANLKEVKGAVVWKEERNQTNKTVPPTEPAMVAPGSKSAPVSIPLP